LVFASFGEKEGGGGKRGESRANSRLVRSFLSDCPAISRTENVPIQFTVLRDGEKLGRAWEKKKKEAKLKRTKWKGGKKRGKKGEKEMQRRDDYGWRSLRSPEIENKVIGGKKKEKRRERGKKTLRRFCGVHEFSWSRTDSGKRKGKRKKKKKGGDKGRP